MSLATATGSGPKFGHTAIAKRSEIRVGGKTLGSASAIPGGGPRIGRQTCRHSGCAEANTWPFPRPSGAPRDHDGRHRDQSPRVRRLPIFLQAGNLTDILRQVSLIGIISVAMKFVILTGGIDLSVGSILALATVVVAMVLTR